MIDPTIESIYNIILSIFLGIIMVVLIDQLFKKPRIITIYKHNYDQLRNNN